MPGPLDSPQGIANGVDHGIQKASSNLNGESTQDNPSFVLQRQGVFFYETRERPTLRNHRDVLIKVIATGLCGSDIHYWNHGRIGNYVVNNPIVLGHESAGIVEDCGAKVKSLKIGDRVALEPGAGCNTCKTCRSGKYNLCPNMAFAATPPYDGTLAKYYLLPEECCHRLPDNISYREGALIEPLSVAVHCCRLIGDLQSKNVAVFGAGPIGLLVSAVAKAFGASTTSVADILQSRLDFASEYAGSKTFVMQRQSPEENAAAFCDAVGVADGFDVVVDATGAEPCIETGIHSLRRGGMFIQAGLGAPRINFPVGQICDKEATFRGSFRYGPGDYGLAIDLLRTGRVSLKTLITHEYSFAEAEAAFVNVSERRGIKTVIYGPDIEKTNVG